MQKLTILAVLAAGLAASASQARPIPDDPPLPVVRHDESVNPVSGAATLNAILDARAARGLSSAPAPAPGQSGESAADNGGFAPHTQPTDND
jgi:hypothetical protein